MQPVKMFEWENAMDVFALGIYFHQVFQGSVPNFVSGEKYDYVFEGLLSGDKLRIGDDVPQDMVGIISGMLETDPVKRYSMDTVVRLLSGEKVQAQQTVNHEQLKMIKKHPLESTFIKVKKTQENSNKQVA